MNWLSTLPLHHYESMEGKLSDTSPMARAHHLAEEAVEGTATPAQKNLGTVHQSMTTVEQEVTTTVEQEVTTTVGQEVTMPIVEVSTTVTVEECTTTIVQESTTTAVQDSKTLDNVQLLVNDQV